MNPKVIKTLKDLSKHSFLVRALIELALKHTKVDIENHGKGRIIRSIWGGV